MPRIDVLLSDAKGILTLTSDSAALDAEVLLCFVLKKPRTHLRAWPEKILSSEEIAVFKQLINRRSEGEPIAYLTGHREFWSRDFKVNNSVLIPRADTELLIELSLARIPNDKPYKILDLGTGSGIIGITLALERPKATIIATDISLNSLKTAQKNATEHQVENISFQHGHWFSTIKPQQFDLIVSNPPYIAENDPHLQQGDLRFEPEHALISKNNGLNDISHIIQSASVYLKPQGRLLIEHGYNQQNAVQTLFQNASYQNIQIQTDLAQRPRAVLGQKPLD
ncbi:MAG: peptide chain release factor N(5)-glutamine methyltransferase [Methylococcales bacterium]|nr:peptide chain release factor N(5)-glutamine methyltransferase [Methylococcales bacterium]